MDADDGGAGTNFRPDSELAKLLEEPVTKASRDEGRTVDETASPMGGRDERSFVSVAG
jgi:hypothetical protein